MALRPTTKIKVKDTEPAEPEQELFSQRKRPEEGRFRLQVDRQTKGSYKTAEAAEEAGMAIKLGYPIVKVVVYDAVDGVRKDIEPPQA